MIEPPAKLTIKATLRRPSAAQIAAFANVPTGFVVDALGGGGALSHTIQQVGNGRDYISRAFGPALTAENGPADVLASFAALKYIQPGDIVVAGFAAHTGCAAIGDRLAGMLKNNGAAGFVTDGPVRDYEGVVDVGLPIWCTGLTPASPFMSGPGKVGFPLQIGGHEVETGDMIVADQDGVVVVPFERIDEVVAKLPHIRDLEEKLDAEVAAGLKLPSWVEDCLNGDDIVTKD